MLIWKTSGDVSFYRIILSTRKPSSHMTSNDIVIFQAMNSEPAKFPSKKRSLSFFKLLCLVLYTRETLEDHDFLFVLRPLSSRRDIQSSLGSSNRSSVTRCTPEASFVTEMETSRGQICVLLILSFAFGTTALLRLLGGKM